MTGSDDCGETGDEIPASRGRIICFQPKPLIIYNIR